MARRKSVQIRREVIQKMLNHLVENLLNKCDCNICTRFKKAFDGMVRGEVNEIMRIRRSVDGIPFDDWSIEARKLIERTRRSEAMRAKEQTRMRIRI